MISRRYGILFPLAALLACAGGTTMRVAQDDASGDDPVALSPTPETGTPETGTNEQIGDTVTQTPSRETDSVSTETTGATEEKGYAAYGDGAGLEVRRIGQWTRTGVGEARRLVIRDANAWANFWSELGVGDRPAVDFTRDMVVAVAAGQRPTGGYEIAVDRVRQADGELTVEVVETAPGPNCVTTASLTQPVDVVVIPALTARSWSFVERKEVRGC
jgi:protease stability complex PrcB-like protein